jgi:hypothetical protein
MSAQVPNRTADAAAGANSVKRKAEDSEDGPERKIPKSDQVPNTTEPCISDVAEQIDMSPKGRALRLEQNRKAAMESRRRKKIMIEELQRSVVFFSRANGALRHQNDDLTRLLMKARSYIGDLEAGKKEGMASSMTVTQTTSVESGVREQMETSLDQAHAEAVAAQAAYESQGFPAAAARAAAQTMSGTSLLAEIPVAAAPAPPTAIPRCDNASHGELPTSGHSRHASSNTGYAMHSGCEHESACCCTCWCECSTGIHGYYDRVGDATGGTCGGSRGRAAVCRACRYGVHDPSHAGMAAAVRPACARGGA